MWTTSLCRAELECGRRHAEIGVRLYRAEEHHHLTQAYGAHDAGVCCRYTRAVILWLLGYPDRAVAGVGMASPSLANLNTQTALRSRLLLAAVVRRFRRESGGSTGLRSRVDQPRD